MDLRPGYKQTDIGVIPEDWQVAKLGHHATFRTGPFGSALHKSDYVYGGIPIVNPMQIIDGKLVPTPRMTISEAAAHRLSEYRLCDGDVVIGRRGDMGRCAVVEPESDGWLCGTGSMIVRPKASLDGRFAQRVLSDTRTVAAIEAASVGTTMVNLNQGALSNLLIPLPGRRAEQADIAEALSDADALIDALEQLVAKKHQIKQGAMQALLTGKKRLPGFSGDWVATRLGDLATFHKGRGLPKSAIDPFGANPCIHYGELFTRYAETIREIISSTDLLGDCFRSASNDVLMPTSDVTPDGLAKASCVITTGVVLGGDILVIRADAKRLSGTFLSYVIRHAEAQILQLVTGSTVFHLYAADMRKFVFNMPSLTEQQAIVSVLDDMGAEIAALEVRLAKARQLKQGMMQVLLTGGIRLPHGAAGSGQ
jgi:type I restriction enzyme S subunit